MTSGGSQDWRGGRAPRNAGQQENAVPSWKQRRSTRASRPGTGSLWSKIRIVLTTLVLLSLVAAVIAFMWPTTRHRTHVVVLAVMENSGDFDTAATFTLPEGIDKVTSRREVTVCHPAILALHSTDSVEQNHLAKADTVVIHLQTTFVAGPDGQFRCLIRNSTPNLDNPNEFATLETLKSQLDSLWEEHPSKCVLLIVDSPPTSHEWRTGCLHSSLLGEFEQWTQTFQNLVVLMSSSSSGFSEPGTAGTKGTSIFSHFASLGFSDLANRDSDQKLTVAEFCAYVTERTDRWVRDHRHIAGQSVTVLPTLASLSESGRDFTLLTDLVSLPKAAEQIGGKSNADLAAIEQQWMRRQSLLIRGGLRWNPVLWVSATEDLVRAERAFLFGQDETARRVLARAAGTLRELEQEIQAVCPAPESIVVDRGIFLSDFTDLPSQERVRNLLFPGATGETRMTVGVTSAEEVLAAHFRAFPFRSCGIPEPADVDSIRLRRAAAETAMAQMLGCADQMQATTKSLEASLLISEDRSFTRRPSAAERAKSEDLAPDSLMGAMSEFIEVRDRAETSLFEVLDAASSLASWAMESGWELSESERQIWRKALAANSPEVTMTGDRLSALFDPLKGISDQSDSGNPDYGRAAGELRKEVFRLLVTGRVLQQSLLFKEPDQGFSTSELQAVTNSLKSADEATSRSQRKILNLIETMCVDAAEDKPAKRAGQVRTCHFLRSALSLTLIRPETRMSVLRSLQEWDAKLSVLDGTSSQEIDQDDSKSLRSTPADQALWMLQVMNFLPETASQAAPLTEAWNAASEMATNTVGEEHNAAARFGEAVRNSWKQNQDEVIAATQNTTSNAHRLLRTADQRVRLFSGFDAERRSLHSPTVRLRQFNRIRCCLMQADRMLSGLWIEPQDAAPFAQNGWYARVAESWLSAARKGQMQMASEALGAPAFFADSIRQMETRLLASEQLSLRFGTEQPTVDLGEQSKDRGSLQGIVMMKGSAGVFGEASVFVRIEPGASFIVDDNAGAMQVRDTAEESVLSFRRLGNPGVGDCQAVSVSPEVFFRGRYTKSPQVVSVNPCAPAEYTVWKTARDQTASVTVLGADPRPVVLILDFSASMKDPLSGNTQTLKFLEALATLDRLIDREELTGARVILNVYGHRTRYLRESRQHDPNKGYTENFGKVVSPTLRADDDIETEFDGTINTPEDRIAFRNVLEKLKRSEPWGTTPLTKALTDAIKTTLRGKQGIVIAVTDGEATDMTETRRSLLVQALQDNPGTSVGIVAFDLNINVGERERLDTTFRLFERISIDDASEQEQLLRKVYESLDPRKYSLISPSGKINREAQLGKTIENLSPASDYSVQFDQLTSPIPFALNRGDQLRLDLDRIGKRFLFIREKSSVSKPTVGDVSAADSPTMLKSIAPARLSDLPAGQNPDRKKAELSLMLDHQRDDLPVRQPAEVELAVRSASSSSVFRPPLIQQVFTSRAGAPGWDLAISEWPKDQRFLVDAVWKMERTPPEYVIRWNALQAADSVDAALPVQANGLPEFKVWVTLRGNQLQVRLDPVTAAPQPERALSLGDQMLQNRVEDIRIEIGNKDTSDQNAAFQPWETETRVVRLETGSVRYEFSGDQISPENLGEAQFALTSAVSRRTGATEVRDFPID